MHQIIAFSPAWHQRDHPEEHDFVSFLGAQRPEVNCCLKGGSTHNSNHNRWTPDLYASASFPKSFPAWPIIRLNSKVTTRLAKIWPNIVLSSVDRDWQKADDSDWTCCKTATVAAGPIFPETSHRSEVVKMSLWSTGIQIWSLCFHNWRNRNSDKLWQCIQPMASKSPHDISGLG